MLLSTRSRLSLQMMVEIARSGGSDGPVSLSSVARRLAASHGYLEHLARAMRDAGLLRGIVGRHGGYVLARPAAEISVRQVVEAAAGKIEIAGGLSDPEPRPTGGGCECRTLFALINQRLTELLDEVRLADLMDPAWRQIVEARLEDGTGGRRG